MTHFQPRDRVTVPDADGRGRLPGTVLLTFSNSLRPVLVHVDGDDPAQCEAFALADVEPLRTFDTRTADSVAAACYEPPVCEVCGGPTRQGYGNYCSTAHRRIVEGIPSPEEIAHDV